MRILNLQFFCLALIACGLPLAHAEQSPELELSVLEKTQVSIRLTNNTPYAEFRPCESCPLRLLPFAANAQLNIAGKYIERSELQNSQVITGTVFIQNRPVDSINKIVGN